MDFFLPDCPRCLCVCPLPIPLQAIKDDAEFSAFMKKHSTENKLVVVDWHGAYQAMLGTGLGLGGVFRI